MCEEMPLTLLLMIPGDVYFFLAAKPCNYFMSYLTLYFLLWSFLFFLPFLTLSRTFKFPSWVQNETLLWILSNTSFFILCFKLMALKWVRDETEEKKEEEMGYDERWDWCSMRSVSVSANSSTSCSLNRMKKTKNVSREGNSYSFRGWRSRRRERRNRSNARRKNLFQISRHFYSIEFLGQTSSFFFFTLIKETSLKDSISHSPFSFCRMRKKEKSKGKKSMYDSLRFHLLSLSSCFYQRRLSCFKY